MPYPMPGLLMSPAILVVLSLLSTQSCALEYFVGDSFWSIPPANDFYSNWSSSHFFQIGDILYFDFDSGLHNVIQVSRREYESCSADNPFKIFRDGPAIVELIEEGVFYFICSIANYCALGQKLSVVVHHEMNPLNSAPIPYPTPRQPSSPSLQPSAPQTSQKPPSASSPYSSQATNNMLEWSISLVGMKNAGDQCLHGVTLGWFAALCLVIYCILV